jgi:hypothetical protein
VAVFARDGGTPRLDARGRLAAGARPHPGASIGRRFAIDKKAKTPKKPKQPKTADKKK